MRPSTDEEMSVGHERAYTEAGVDTARQEQAVARLLVHVRGTFANRSATGRPLLDVGPFANVLDLGQGVGLAVSMDGVGTKALVAQIMDKYDTIGIDCVAMNVNDLLCVGAEPLAMLDYVAVQVPHDSVFEALGVGLARGAEQASITIPGGEVAQIREMLSGYGENRGFDLVGCAVGIVPTERMLVGRDLQEGDAVVGLRSSGVHSNGLSLARKVLLDKAGYTVHSYVPELGQTVGEELLQPTRIYVRVVRSMLEADLSIKALAHVTSDGLLNLSRVEAQFGFVIEYLPEPQPIFQLIASLGEVAPYEMFRVFNMGIGFCVVLDPKDASQAIEIAAGHGVEAWVLGYAVPDGARAVHLKPAGLIGKGKDFVPA